MKRHSVILVLLFLAIELFAQDDVASYRSEVMKALMLANLKTEGLFRYTVVPTPIELAIITLYPSWKEKRFNQERMLKEIEELKAQYKIAYPVYLMLFFTGSWDSKGKTSLEIPKDLAEYIFIENDVGEYLACKEADIPIMGAINTFNENETISLTFPSVDMLLESSQHMILELGGLGFKDTRFTYSLPPRTWFAGAPEVLKKLYLDSGIWKD